MESTQSQGLTAREAELKSCASCGALQKMDEHVPCLRCGGAVHSRREFSLQRAWSFLFVGLLAYIPANIYPIMLTTSLTGDTSDTILSGVFVLVSSESYLVALIVFVASILIPVTKFVIIAGLALSLQFNWDTSERVRHHLHSLIEFIGRWSMIDVFVVAVLAALIQLGSILTITPGSGISAFAISVIFTMFSANSLDSRLLWENNRNDV